MADVQINEAELHKLLTSEDGPVGRELLKVALKVERAAKRLCPVDTGRLRASISHEMKHDERGLYAVVGSTVEYAIYQELGTRHQPGSPFLRPALREVTGGN